ncbi:aminotransferase class V-fold PLP-dependent enzyme [Microbacterium sp. W1N]|uniref:aminotransferase class V-fold PLP-dependent enzyme n=1 Tax=Microbacterium festucae TaxID=2977531 RepID=UPI0021C0FC4F|nr:aminotransferase class V-fold PLP-dependent enzyme [Microbacterium festucae]MCT9820363.1 aminotransferase class V-fold PLP-dependent enzyme [Microbacterium festucae]
MSLATPLPPAPALRAEFGDARGYLAACTAGLVTEGTRRALRAELDRRPDVAAYCSAVEASRAAFAQLVAVTPDRVAIGSQTSVQLSVLAAALPDGATVLVPDGEFSSVVLPFAHAGRGIRVRTAPLHALAAAIDPTIALVAFSLVQSATGEIADADAIVAAARRVGARTVCDATQAVGWMPVDAAAFDALLCHAYKWLCCPRGVAFMTVTADYARALTPVQAGWYAGDDPWASCYGGEVDLAGCARRFDVSPAWQAFVGAEPALRAFAAADIDEVHAHVTRLAGAFRERLGLPAPQRESAIVTWADPDGAALAALTAAGITASGRRGRARVAFHVFNDRDDLERAAAALGR